MKHTLKLGDKVVPIRKRGKVERLDQSVCLKRAMGAGRKFLYVNGFDEGLIICREEYTASKYDGDYFELGDLIPLEVYEEMQNAQPLVAPTRVSDDDKDELKLILNIIKREAQRVGNVLVMDLVELGLKRVK